MNGYKKCKILGCGTFGTVYLCKKNNHSKIVLKEIHINLNENSLKNAENEVKILKNLIHPNIIKYYWSYISKHYFCILIEYAKKGNLYEFLSKRRPDKYLEQKMILNIFSQILLGIDYIHSKNIIHRDLKSENILISGHKYDIIKIADFGISKLLENTSGANTLIGTCNYLAPELCNGNKYNMKSDIWALGCILFEICSLERLFEGTLSNIVLSISQGKIKTIDTSLYSFEIQEIINKLLTIDPSIRPNTKDIIKEPILIPIIFKLLLNLGRTTTDSETSKNNGHF